MKRSGKGKRKITRARQRIFDLVERWVPEEQQDDILTLDEFDDCVVGVVERHTAKNACLCYDYDKMIENMMRRGMDYSDAVDYIGTNIEAMWIGEFTPFMLYRNDDIINKAMTKRKTKTDR